MKKIMQRSYSVLIVTLAFFVGIMFVGYKVFANSGKWVEDPANLYLTNNEKAGDILDRNGTVLAYTDDEGHRRYHEDESVRKALLHVVGDTSLNISTAVQSMFRADLSGYSYFMGMGAPDSLRSEDVRLTIDAEACRAAYEAMDGYKGACIVYNYKTGEVLCSVSNPTYDPADPPTITDENLDEYDGVYLDNVLSSTYTPGSTFKIITAAAAIESIPDIYQRRFTCSGSYEVLGKSITCEKVHGNLTFEEAISHSCNCVVAQIAIEIGDDKLMATAKKFGFNHEGYTISGIPLAESTYDAVGAGDNYLAWSGIGQYTDLANPAHMAMIAGAIANGGTAVSPYIVYDDGSLFGRLGIRNNQAPDVNMISSSTAEKVKTIMRKAAQHYGVSVAGLNFCAKTGTAEIDLADGSRRSNAWFVGFIEDERYPYAFAVVREVPYGYGITSYSVIDAAVSALVNR